MYLNLLQLRRLFDFFSEKRKMGEKVLMIYIKK